MSSGDDRSRSNEAKERRKRSPRSNRRQRGENPSTGSVPNDIGATLALILKGQEKMLAGQTEMSDKLTNVTNDVTSVKVDVGNFRGEVEERFKKQQEEIKALKTRPAMPAAGGGAGGGGGGARWSRLWGPKFQPCGSKKSDFLWGAP